MKQSNTNFIKTLQLIYTFLIASVVIFALYVAYWQKDLLFFSVKEEKTFLYLAILVAFAGNLASKFMYNKQINQIFLNHSFKEKKVKYTSANIVKIALLEAPAIMCIMFVLQSGNSFYFILVAILMFMMVLSFPSKSKFEQEVPLKGEEKSKLQNL